MSRRSWLLLASLYTTQYLGLGFFVVALVAILRQRGAGLDTVSLVYMLGLVWPLKALWAPAVDRFGMGWLGHYRGWLILTQSALVLLLLAIGGLDVIDDFGLVYTLCLLVALLSATQDIAVDGLACRLLTPAERGLGNGLQIAGGLIGNLVGGGVILMAYPQIGWTASLILLAAGTAISLFQLLGFREPRWERRRRDAGALAMRLLSFWRAPGSGRWLALLLLFPMGSGMAYAVMMPALIDAGWDLDRVGLVVNVSGSLAGLAAALATGWLMARVTRRAALIGAGLVQLAGILAVFLPVQDGTGALVGSIGVVLFFIGYNPAATVLATLMMDHAAPASPATDYTLQYSVNQFAAMATMSAAAALAASLGYAGVLALAAVTATAATWLALGYRRGRPAIHGAADLPA
ncbi:MFS transporter [Ancylobacter sp. SL191]|uniref:MFS transporter n=1 Tax=Ancylobacter sp. SL191 TaxID=2995166 RepID=UPI00226FE8F6|nr:MFS transporter [Ancylobacter sp. SL191]WAC26637.1 MFS transporter [Ancylobacter sp. SL191]